MSKNLFDGYKTKYSIIQANDLSLQADYLFEALKQNVYLESISSYLDLIHLRQSYDLTEQSLMLTKNNLDFTIKYLETNFKNTTHYIISNNISLDTASIKTDVKIFSDLDNFLEDISQA